MSGRRSFLAREVALYLSAHQFLTRLPAPAWIGWSDDRLARAAKWFPAVGLVLGGMTGLLWVGFAMVIPPALAAGLALVALLLLTGGLHEDGLADCCDGLGGGTTRARALEIMRDSRIGAYGALGLLLSVGLRWAALVEIGPWAGWAALLVALTAGRAAMTMMLWSGVYARADGAASSASDRATARSDSGTDTSAAEDTGDGTGRGDGTGMGGGVTGREALFAMGTALATGLVFGGMTGALATLGALVLAQLWLLRLTSRLGGYTGDGLGAGEQLAQILVLFVFAGAAF